MVDKAYIENLVISECRRLLSAENIRRIAKEIVSLCESEKDTSNLKRLQKLLSENKRKQQNTINAIMESNIESVRKKLESQIPILEAEQEEIERQITKEQAVHTSITEPQIIFFLTSLKKGKIDDIKYRKNLIKIFINRVYLFDDRVTITYNSGDNPVTINDRLLSELEEKDENERVLFFNGSGPPE